MNSFFCGICSDTVSVETILIHDCFQGFNQVFVDDNSHVWPQMNVKAAEKTITKGGVLPMPMALDYSSMELHSENNTSMTNTDSVEETLINAVQKHEPLWNHKLPITERGRNTVRELWEEVVTSMDGKVKDVEEAKKMWKNLRYNYGRVLEREQAAKRSGAAGKGKGTEAKWCYHHQMAFTRDILINSRQTSTNVEESSPSESSATFEDSAGSSQAPKRFASSRRGDSIEESISRLTRVLEKPLPPVPQLTIPELLPAPGATDDDFDSINHVIGLIKATMKKLVTQDRQVFILELLTSVVKTEKSI